MPKPIPKISIDPNSPAFENMDEAARAFAATFPNDGSETAGMLYKDTDGQFRYSTSIPGTDEHFKFGALVPKGVSLGAIVHSHPGKDQLGQVFSPDDLDMANQMKLPSYIRFLNADDLRVYRPGVTKTEKMPMEGTRFGVTVARGDALQLAKAQIAEQLSQTNPVTP